MLRELLGGIPEESALEAKGIKEYWETFRDSLLQAQEQSIHLSRKRSWHSKKPAWLSSELQRELRCKKKEHERDGKGNRLPKQNIETPLDAERKAKAQLEPKLA